MSIRAGLRTADGDTVPSEGCPAVLRAGPWGPAGSPLHAAQPVVAGTGGAQARDHPPAAPVHAAQDIYCHLKAVLLVAVRVSALHTIAVGHLLLRVAVDVLRGRREEP